jgi:hypothetical protein
MVGTSSHRLRTASFGSASQFPLEHQFSTAKRKGNMNNRSVVERGDYRRLPKGLRRLLVFSETFFFREFSEAKPRKKTRQAEVHKTSASLAFCE